MLCCYAEWSRWSPGSCNFCTQLFGRQVCAGPGLAPWRHLGGMGSPFDAGGELAEVPLASLREETGPAQPPPRVQFWGPGAVFSEPGVKARAARYRRGSSFPVGLRCKSLLERQFLTRGGQGQGQVSGGRTGQEEKWPSLQCRALPRPVQTRRTVRRTEGLPRAGAERLCRTWKSDSARSLFSRTFIMWLLPVLPQNVCDLEGHLLWTPPLPALCWRLGLSPGSGEHCRADTASRGPPRSPARDAGSELGHC